MEKATGSSGLQSWDASYRRGGVEVVVGWSCARDIALRSGPASAVDCADLKILLTDDAL